MREKIFLESMETTTTAGDFEAVSLLFGKPRSGKITQGVIKIKKETYNFLNDYYNMDSYATQTGDVRLKHALHEAVSKVKSSIKAAHDATKNNLEEDSQYEENTVSSSPREETGRQRKRKRSRKKMDRTKLANKRNCSSRCGSSAAAAAAGTCIVNLEEITASSSPHTSSTSCSTASSLATTVSTCTVGSDSSSVAALVEPEQVMSDTSAWELLQEKLSFHFLNNMYTLPNVTEVDETDENVTAFRSVASLRTFLAREGIPAVATAVTDEDVYDLSRWVKYCHVPRTASAEEPMTDKKAWKYLTGRGFTYSVYRCRYLIPGVNTINNTEFFSQLGKTNFNDLLGVQEWCCRHGVPEADEDDGRGDQLALWASCSEHDIFQAIPSGRLRR